MPIGKKTGNAMEAAVTLLAKNPLGKKQLLRKLLDKKYPMREVLDAVSECERYGYVNDKLLTEAKVTSMRDRGDGEKKICFTLRRKGFEKELIESALENDGKNFERDELSVAKELLEHKKVTLMREKDPLKRRLKAVRALASKGFSAGVAYPAVAEFLREKNFYEFPDPDEGDISQ